MVQHRLGVVALLALWVVLATTASADMKPSQLTPSTDDEPVLTLVREGEEQRLSLRDLESLDIYDAEIEHFEGKEGVFTGIRLRDFIDEHNLGDVRRIRLIAADDYTTFLRPEELDERDYLLVTRFEGEPMSTEDLGPLMLIVPEDEQAVLSGEKPMTRWIWAITEIRAR